MNIALRGKNIDLTPALREYVNKKVGRITRFFDFDGQAQVSLSREKDRHIIEVTIPVGGVVIRGEEATGDIYASVDLVVEKLDQQVRKFKTRLTKKFRQQGLRAPALAEGEGPGTTPEEEPRVVKTKTFELRPMSVEEAIMQLNLVGHDFYVFEEAESGQVNVVYRRRGGNYGLIQPQTR